MSSFNSMDTNFVPRYEEWHVQSTFLKRNDLTLSARCITSNSTINHCTLQDSLVVDVLMTPYFLLLHDFSQCVYFCSQRVGLVSSIEKWESEQETWMNFVFPKIYWTWHVKVVNIVLFFWYNEGKNAAVEILNWGTRVQIVLEAAQGTVYRQLDILWAFFFIWHMFFHIFNLRYSCYMYRPGLFAQWMQPTNHSPGCEEQQHSLGPKSASENSRYGT